MNLKQFLNAIPIFLGAIALIIAIGKKSPDQNASIPSTPVPSDTSNSTPSDSTPSTPINSELWQVKEGSVHDGDTLKVEKNGREKKIRFACIDAPEIKQPGGVEARDYLRSLLKEANNQVYVEPVDEDRYGRTVALLWIDRGRGKESVQQLEVDAGLVWGYERYKDNCNQWSQIASGMERAKSAKLGIWQGNATSPWSWRQANK